MNLLVNKGVNRSYEIIETVEAGIKLAGWEVKTLRQKHGSIKEAYVTINDEVFLVGAHIPPYQGGHKDLENVDPYRPRKLLLSKDQIKQLTESAKQRGLTLVPVCIYEKGNLIKVEIALAKGKKKYDKRNDMKDRSAKREADRAMKDL